MNKTEFINALEKQLKYSKTKCTIINDVLENNFFLSKQNQEKIVTELAQRLEVSTKEAEKIYQVATGIINDEVKAKFRHPFRSKD